MSKFAEDFSEISSLLGPVDESDSFNWSQFRMETNDDVERLFLTAASLGEKAIEKNVSNVLGEKSDKSSASFDAKKPGLLNPSILRDADGRMWSGVILDTDMVQKTMPGNRVGTHRALVVIGNLRGTAGFGMGKGKTSGDALNSAFRYMIYFHRCSSLQSLSSAELPKGTYCMLTCTKTSVWHMIFMVNTTHVMHTFELRRVQERW